MVKPTSKTIYGQKTPAEVRAAIQDICKKNNYDPFEQLIKLATDTEQVMVDGKKLIVPVASVDQRIVIAKEIASYIAPKIKNIEVKQEIEGEFTFKIINHAAIPLPEVNIAPGKQKMRQGVNMLTNGAPGKAKIVEAEVVDDES